MPENHTHARPHTHTDTCRHARTPTDTCRHARTPTDTWREMLSMQMFPNVPKAEN